MRWPKSRRHVPKPRYLTKTALLTDLLVQCPGQTVRWYGERIQGTRLVVGKLLCRLRERGLAEAKDTDDRLYNARRWYPTVQLCDQVASRGPVDNTQIRLLTLLGESPWLTCREIVDTLAVPLNTVRGSLRVLHLRGEIKPHRRSPAGPVRAWALADEETPYRRRMHAGPVAA